MRLRLEEGCDPCTVVRRGRTVHAGGADLDVNPSGRFRRRCPAPDRYDDPGMAVIQHLKFRHALLGDA